MKFEKVIPEVKQQAIPQFYSDVEFDKNFSKWEKVIIDGRKTPTTMLEFLSKKGIKLSDEQFSKLKDVKQISE